ncbi:glycosyltransferase family 4 protein [Clostridium perfringens]|uniref:glycosyltransferase family 4 protein n=1 Tax=Clostridium perfringens TaxID=1502 RepID=UPI00374F94E3
MKKILFVSNISDRISNFSIPSIEAGQRLGYEVHLAANYSNFSDNADKYNVRINHIDIIRNPLAIGNIKALIQMCKLIKKEKYDMIHCNTPIGGILGRISGKICGVSKVIYTAHGFHFYKGAPIVNNLIYKNIERLLARITDGIITINKEDYNAAKKLKLRKNGKVYYIPGVGINTDEYYKNGERENILRKKLGITNEEIIIISMGDLIKRKNYKSSLEAIAKLKGYKIRYLICGKGPEFDNLKKLANKLQIENMVEFLGFRKDVKELLHISDIFLFTTYQEGLPRSTMEAMASGLPCVVSNIRGNTDLINNNKGGYLCNPNDINDISEKIIKLYNNKILREKMGRINLNEIKKYDVKEINKEMFKIYSSELKII